MIDTVALLRSVNLVDLIGRDADWVKGRRFTCPFCQTHDSKSPALQVYDQNFYCFGCGARGDAIDYVMQKDDVDFLEACRRLGWAGDTMDRTELERSRAEYLQRKMENEQERAARLDQLLKEYTAEEIWSAYHRKMGQEHIAWWVSQGVPPGWQDYLRLGYTPDKAYYDRTKTLRHSPAYTIPYFHHGFVFRNMQYRLSDPDNPKDRYRFESGLRTTYYMVMPDEPPYDVCVICEGAKKAMVCCIRAALGEETTYLAVPSKTDFGGVADAVKERGLVWIIPDPDAWDRPANAPADWTPPPIRLARAIGKAARIVRLPIKVDDGINHYGLKVSNYLKLAVKP